MKHSDGSLNSLRLTRWRDLIAFSYGTFAAFSCRKLGADWVLTVFATIFIFLFVVIVVQAVFDETVPFVEQSGCEAIPFAQTTTFILLAILGLSSFWLLRTASFYVAGVPLVILFLYPYGVVLYVERNPPGGGSRAPHSSPYYQQGTQVSFTAPSTNPRIKLIRTLNQLWNSRSKPGAPMNSTWEALKKKGYFDD